MTDKRQVLLHGSLCRQKRRGSAFTKSWVRRYFSVERVDTLSRYGSSTIYRLCYYKDSNVSDVTKLLSLKPKYWSPLDEIISVASAQSDRSFRIRTYTRDFFVKAQSLAERNYWIVGLLTLTGLNPRDGDEDILWPFEETRPRPEQVVFGGTINETLARERRVSQERIQYVDSDSSEGSA